MEDVLADGLTNKNNVQVNILLVQGGIVTVLILLFTFMSSVQAVYQILSQLTVILYLTMYILLFLSGMKLRRMYPDLPRPFRVPGGRAGIYVLEFCKARRIPTEQVSLTQQIEFELDPQGKRRVSKVGLTINLPPDFPERYQKAIVKAAELCSVKKAIMNPPEFVVDYQVTA